MELVRTTYTALNITSETEILSYTYSGVNPITVIARVELGDDTNGIAGNDTYTLNVYINDKLVTPITEDIVPSGVTKTIVLGRHLLIEADDEISVKVIGAAGDTAVNTVGILQDVTPVQQSLIYGTGEVEVDHDYGGTDNLAYKTSSDVGISGAVIRIFLTSDYDAGNRTVDYLIALANTTTGGRWVRSVMLTPGDYSLIYYKQTAYGPDRKDLTVS